jgi:hypothetical protein
VNPIRYAGVVAFVDWLSRHHPEVRSLRELDSDRFLALAIRYEASKGLRIDDSHQVHRKWRATHGLFQRSDSDTEALERLRRWR